MRPTFAGAAMTVAKRVAFMPVTTLLRHLGCMLLATLAGLGLLRLPQRWGWGGGGEVEPLEESDDYVLVMDGGTLSLVHVHVLTPLIKKQVPVVEYGEFVERQRCSAAGGAEEVRCAVCLSGVEKKDEIRELWNCSHVFHRQCLDCWVDLGHVTCPLCRSLLLPPSSNMGMMRAAAAASSFAASASPGRQGGREDNELETWTN